MRYDAEHKDRTRAKVLTQAARALKADGPEKLGVAEVMKAAGLTHGGFYAHFPSKAALVAEAVEAAFADSRALYDQAAAGKAPHEALAGLIRSYLSRAHRDHADQGCVLPALSADLPRMDDDARARYAEGLARMTARVAALLQAIGAAEPQALASSMVAEMVGAVALARAVTDPDTSAAILKNSRAALLRRAGLEEAP